MANQTITQLPDAGPITGTELVPVVQNGGTVKTTAAALAGSPVQTQTFLTKNQELTLNNSRYLTTDTGLGLTDGGPTSFYRISLNGTSGSLETAGGGVIVKNSGSTVVARTLQTSGAGLSVSNGNGTGGNPTFQLTGLAAAIANMGGTSMLAVVNGTTIAGRQIVGTNNQIDVTDGNGSGNPTISIVNDAILPGTGAVTLPQGNTSQQPMGAYGQLRYNTQTNRFEGYNGSWQDFSQGAGVDSFSAGATGLLPSSPTIGPVVLSGVLNVAHGGSGATSLTGYVKGNGTSPMTASATVPTTDLSGTITNAQLDNSSLTVNGTNISLGASGTITSSTTQPLTFGAGMTPGSFDGGTAQTVSLANTGVTAGSFGGSSKTLTASVNAQGQLTSLSESSIAIANTQVSGLGTMSTQNSSNVSITGGAIDATTIGATAAAAGTFTSVATTTGTISTTPANATDIANKQYVDNLVSSGITYHAPVKYEVPNSTGNLNATYNQPGGPGVGVGATLTNAGTLAAFAPDGPTAAPGDRVLIYNQTNQFENGVYDVTTVGDGSTPWVLTRSADADTYGLKDPNSLGNGDAFFVTSGNTGAGETYVCNTTGAITFGTTAITFAQVSSAQVYSAGNGLTLTGTQFALSTPVSAANGGVGQSSYAAGDTIYATGTLTLSKLAIGATSYIMTSSGSAPQWSDPAAITVGSATSATTAASATTATTATNLAGGFVGDLPYQSGSGTTSLLPAGSLGYVLQANGAAAPSWVAQSTLSVGSASTAGSATSATTATNLAGGSAGALAYNTSAGATTFLSLGALDYVLVAGATAPQYAAQSSLSVGSATNATNAANVATTSTSTNANFFIPFVAASTSGNQALGVDAGITYNPSTNAITGGISGGTF